MKVIKVTNYSVADDKLLRCKCKIGLLNTQIKEYFIKNPNFFLVKDIFDIISGFAFQSKDYVQNGIPLIRIGDLNNDFTTDNAVYLPEEYFNEFNRFQIKPQDILVSLTGDGTLKTAFMSEGGMLLNQRVAILRAKKNIEAKVYYYLFDCEIVKSQFIFFSNGKSQLNISPFDFGSIKVPYLKNKQIQDVRKKILPLEESIKVEKAKILSHQEIIDEIFSREFNFDYDTFEELKTKKTFNCSNADFANNPDLRFSAKFHREAGEFAMKQLTDLTTKRIKHFLSEPIVLGASISPVDYNVDGDSCYISMATIKNWEFSYEEAQTVCSEYSEAQKTKTVRNGDIIVARSGEGTIGKVAIIEDEDLQGVFADFTMRIRLKNYNLKFAYYYFRTTYFQYFIEVYKKGLGNNTNIFPIVIKEFPLLDINLDEQQRIVNEIYGEVTKQNVAKDKIDRLRGEINSIIEEAIRG